MIVDKLIKIYNLYVIENKLIEVFGKINYLIN